MQITFLEIILYCNFFCFKELITWSRDQTLRIWKIDEALKKLCESPLPDDDSKFSF